MDKETLSHYGWIVVLVLILSVMIAMATPFGTFVANGFKSTYIGFGNTGDGALDVILKDFDIVRCEHKWTSTTTATCTQVGKTTYTCTECGKTYKESAEAGHKFSGTNDRTCDVCDLSFLDYTFVASDYDTKMGTTTATDEIVNIPATFGEILQRLSSAPRLVGIDAINLFDSGLSKLCDVTVAIIAPIELRVQRLVQRDGITEEYARKRINAQLSNEHFASLCQYVLKNNGNIHDFLTKCFAFLQEVDIINLTN